MAVESVDMESHRGWRDWMCTLEIPAGDDAGSAVSAEVMRERWEAGHRGGDPAGVMSMPWYERKPEDCREEFFDALELVAEAVHWT